MGNQTQEQMIANAQRPQLPEEIRRGRGLSVLIEDVVRGLWQIGHRVTGLRLSLPDLADLTRFASTVAGNKVSPHGYLTDEIGYVPLSTSGGAMLDGHVTFETPGANLPGGNDIVSILASKEAPSADAVNRLVQFKAGIPVASIVRANAPEVVSEPEDKAASAESAPAEGGEPGTPSDGAGGADAAQAPSMVPGVPGVDGPAAADVPAGDAASAGVPATGGARKAAKTTKAGSPPPTQ
jgi:hypothetical protein